MPGAINTLINPNFPVTSISRRRAYAKNKEYRGVICEQGCNLPEGSIVYLTQIENQIFCTPCPANETYPRTLAKGEEWNFLRDTDCFSTETGQFGVSIVDTTFSNFEGIFDVYSKENSGIRMRNLSNETFEIGDLIYADVPTTDEVDVMLNTYKLSFPVFVPRKLKKAARRVERTLQDTLENAKAINESQTTHYRHLTKNKSANIMLDLFSIVGIILEYYKNHLDEIEKIQEILDKIRRNTHNAAYVMKTIYQELKLFNVENESGQMILRRLQNLLHAAEIYPFGLVQSVEYHSQGDGTVTCRPGEYFFLHIY